MLDALAAATRVLLYAGLLTCSGAVFASATGPRDAALQRFAMMLMRRGAYATVATASLSAVLLFFQLGGDWDDPTLLAVFGSSRGAALCLQLVGALLLLALPVDDAPLSGIRISNAAILTASLAITGHAVTEGLLNALVVLAHVSAAAWWIASLLLMRHAWMNETQEQFAIVVRQFSTWALRIVVGLVVAGAILVATLVDFAARPFVTPYVTLLLVKIGLATTVLGIAAQNRRGLTPRVLSGDAGAAASLCRRIDVELALLSMVLIATAVLVSYTSPS